MSLTGDAHHVRADQKPTPVGSAGQGRRIILTLMVVGLALLLLLAWTPGGAGAAARRQAERRISLSLAGEDVFAPEVVAAHNARVVAGSSRPMATGELIIAWPDFQPEPGTAVLPWLRNYDDPAVVDVATVRNILSNAGLRAAHVAAVVAFVALPDANGNFAGIVIDYRNLPPDLREVYTGFLRELVQALHTASPNLSLTVVLPAPVCGLAAESCDSGGYDWPAIGQIADEVVITMPLDPLAYEAGGPAETVLAWAVNQVEPDKLSLGVSALSIEEQGEGLYIPVTLDGALRYLDHLGIQLDPPDPVAPGETVTARLEGPSGVRLEVGWQTHTPYVRYTDAEGTPLRTMWLTDAVTLRVRLALADEYDLGGVFVRDLMSPGVLPGLDTALAAYDAGDSAAVAAFNPTLEWTVRDGDNLIRQVTGPPDQPLEIQTSADQALVIEARFYGRMIGRQAVALADGAVVLAPDSTPLPEPTPIVVPTVVYVPPPEETPDAPVAPLPAVDDDSPAMEPGAALIRDPGQPFPTVAPSILANADMGDRFEGGAAVFQVTEAIPAILENGNFQWARLEIVFRAGMGEADAATHQPLIDDLHARDVKVLFSVVGDPAELLASTDRAAYAEEYAVFVAALARRGADGIEVWHAMNDAAWWPNDELGPLGYTQLLVQAYNAIKVSRPGVMVITGGLTPSPGTGPVGNDEAYLAALVQAGAAHYTDCIGMVYTHGAAAPDSTSGDPRGDDPTYYLPTVTERAWTAFGSQTPVCYTRFGYLSPEGYPPLPDGYAWAQAITAAQQAAWLVDAARWGQTSRKIRLWIVWSLDSAPAGGDNGALPGYAILRPDGSCPACEALEPVLAEPVPLQ